MSIVKNSFSRSFVNGQVIALVFAAVCVACNSDGGGSPSSSVPCSGGVADCRTFSKKPACADGASAVCSVNGVCIYRLTNSVDCRCFGGEVQTCDLGNGHEGVSTCVAGPPTATGAQTTHWGDCTTLP